MLSRAQIQILYGIRYVHHSRDIDHSRFGQHVRLRLWVCVELFGRAVYTDSVAGAALHGRCQFSAKRGKITMAQLFLYEMTTCTVPVADCPTTATQLREVSTDKVSGKNIAPIFP